jgi:hypothetical protein
MTPADYQKDSGKGKYKGQPRAAIFEMKVRNKSTFTLTNGQKVMGTRWDHNSLTLYVGTRKIPLAQIKKDEDMGGGGGSGAGADVTAATESGQCFVSSIATNVLKRQIKWEDLTLENLKKASQYCDTDIKLDEVIEKSDPEWVQSYIKTANLLQRSYRMSGFPVFFHRGSSFMKAIYDAKKKVHDNDKKTGDPQAPGSFSDDKWNPGDIWMTTLRQVPKLSTDSWEALNKDIYDLAQQKKLLGVSLKKVDTTAHDEEYNIPGKIPSSVQFRGYRLSSATERGSFPPFFNSIDLYLMVGSKEIQFRATSGEASWQGEIKGETAAGGKIGGGNVNFYLKKYTGKSLFDKREEEVMQFTKTPDFFKEFFKLYQKYFEGTQVGYDDFVQYATEKQKESRGYIFSKYMNIKFIDIFLSANPQTRNDIAEAFFRYAASNTDQSSYFVKIS